MKVKALKSFGSVVGIFRKDQVRDIDESVALGFEKGGFVELIDKPEIETKPEPKAKIETKPKKQKKAKK